MKPDNVLRNFVLTGIFALTIVPLIVANSLFFPFITGKAFFFRIVVEIIAAVWIILALRKKEYMPKLSLLIGGISLFTLIAFIANLLGVQPERSMWSNFERMEGWVLIAHLWLYFVVVGSVMKSEKIWNRFFNTTIAVSVILVIHGLFQLGGLAEIHQGSTRLDASLGNAIYLAVYLLIHIGITCLMLYRKWYSIGHRYTYGIIAILQLVILYNTGTRGTILGLIGGTLLGALIIAIAKRNNIRIRNTAIGVIAVLFLLIGSFQMIKDTPFVQNNEILSRLGAISLSDAAPRLAIWKMAIEGSKENIILGWGQENFNYIFNEYYEPSMFDQEQWFDRAHNVFLDWLVASGVLGLMSYLTLFGAAVWYIWNNKNWLDFYEKVLLTSILAAYFIHNLFVFDNLVSYMLFVTLLAYVHSQNAHRELPVVQKIDNDKFAFAAIPLVGVVLIFSIYYVNMRPINAGKTLIEAISLRGGVHEQFELFNKALAYNSFADQEIREQLASATLRIYRGDASDEEKQEFFNLAWNELKKWTEEAPEDARAFFYAGTFLNQFGLFEQSYEYLKRASELSPKKQTILFEVGSNLINQKKYNEALDVFKKTYELDPTFDEPRLMYAIAAMYAGDSQLANNLLDPIRHTSIMYDLRLINAFAAVKDYKSVQAIYLKMLEENPENWEARVSLAATYLAMGDRGAAVSEIEYIIEENPSFKERGEYYLKEIRAGRNP